MPIMAIMFHHHAIYSLLLSAAMWSGLRRKDKGEGMEEEDNKRLWPANKLCRASELGDGLPDAW